VTPTPEPPATSAGQQLGLVEVDDLVEEGELLEPLCEDVETWVEHVYAPVYIRKTGQVQRWCASWWAHPEAIVRLTALWRTWEAARASEEESAMAEWLRSCFDALNPVLLADDGPFASCSPDRHSEQKPMPLTSAPPGYWTTDTD
jgi:Domain of unknown function (DUF4913)